jgi:GTP cyclohydrolase I
LSKTFLKNTMSQDKDQQVNYEVGVPVSQKIRERLKNANVRFHANDNIADYLEPGEIDLIFSEVKDKMKDVLDSLVIDTEGDHNTQGTANRIAKMFIKEVFAGRYSPMPPVTEFPNVSHLNELMVIGPITVRSACSHHFCPIMGKVWIGVLPNENSNLIGLSKYARMTEWIMGRPQIQEEAVIQLADILESKMKPLGLAVVMDADHMCMQWRGVKDSDSKMLNSVMRGTFLKDPNLRREFLSLLGSRYKSTN